MPKRIWGQRMVVINQFSPEAGGTLKR
jgi:hypothetical protein